SRCFVQTIPKKIAKSPLPYNHSLDKYRAPCKRTKALCIHGIDRLPDRRMQRAIAACHYAHCKGGG
ncbi:hypothetical protein, partial [Xanthomonas oryzae]|uniref:hypothetical protein n=1 Tax=Xanthomonas oryzae TaxID=347 RepID=UPI001ED94914